LPIGIGVIGAGLTGTAGIMDQANKITELNYSLTFIQRIVNPMGGFMYRVLSVLIILVMVFSLVMGGYSFIPMWIVAFVIILFDILFFGQYLIETVRIILERDSSRCIVVGSEYFGFGHKKPEYRIPRKLLKVEKGIAGTNLIGFVVRARFVILSRICYIIVPEKTISFSELKKLIEMGEAPSQH
jgi:hypothetical protein